jgi:hypothetical protein
MLNAIETLAVNRVFTKGESSQARDEVAAGTYEVDLTVRVKGTLCVSVDTAKTPTVSIPVKEVLALFVARSGCTREAGLALLRECLTEALNNSVHGVGAIETAVDIDAEFKQAVSDLTASLPKTPVKGPVKAHLEIEKVVQLVEMDMHAPRLLKAPVQLSLPL